MQLTEKQQLDYLRNPNNCPVCGSENIEASKFDVTDQGVGYCHVACNSCPTTWKDKYNLQAITDVESVDVVTERLS